MRTFMRVAALCATGSLAAWPVSAQNEGALKSFFEGRHVTLRIDMPGTSDGVNLYGDASRPVDFGEYKDNLKKYGAALHAGQSATVTLVKIKKDLIEFHLDGGGYGTFGDDTSTSVYMPLLEKSDREKELERKLREENDKERQRNLERELDELRDHRERDNRRIAAEREQAEAQKVEQLAERRLAGGSRFNIRYHDRVPAGVGPDDVMAALGQFVEFQASGGSALAPAPLPPAALPPASADLTGLRKGMARAELERQLGRPMEASPHTVGDVTITTLVFVVGDQRVSADFVEDVLVRYTISSK